MNNVNQDLKIRDEEPASGGGEPANGGGEAAASAEPRGRNPRGEGEKLRASLLEAATELIAESENPENVSVRAVTRRAGVSPTALYLHFENRDELFVAVSEACFAELGDVMRATAEEVGDDPRAQLVAMGHAYLRFARERPGHYAVLFQRHINPDPEDEEKSKIGMGVFESLVDVVRRCGVAEEDAFDSGVLLWMALHGRAAVNSAMPSFPFPDEDRYVELLADRVIG
jgi:AcrR family transcriptional regulator